MAMILIDRKEIEENGEVFIVETYKSDKTGKESVVKYPKPSEIVPEEPVEPEPTEEEIAQAEMLLMQAEILEKLNAMEV